MRNGVGGHGGETVWTSADIVNGFDVILWYFQTTEMEMLLCAVVLKQK